MKRWFKFTNYDKRYDDIEKILNKKRSELKEANEKIILLQNDIHVKSNKILLLEKELENQDKIRTNIIHCLLYKSLEAHKDLDLNASRLHQVLSVPE